MIILVSVWGKKDSFGTFLKKLKNHENGYSRIKRRMEGKWWNNQEKRLINKTIEKNQLKHIYRLEWLQKQSRNNRG